MFLLIFIVITNISVAQTTEEIRKQADELFKTEAFLEATPLYLQLLNVEPRNHELNFKYGACLIYSAQDKTEAIRFLSFSVKNPSIDKLAYFYMGKAYHLNFQFTNALTYYAKFEAVASPGERKKYNITANLNACENGKKLLSNITDMIVLDKVEVKKEDFYELYKLNNIGGNLLITDQFQSKLDKKNGHRPIIYFPDDSPYIFYSSYGNDESTGLDIFVKQKLPNGKWTDAIKVVGDVNTEEDEDYPYLSPDGKFLYFSSKGHNSMGGYDVFKSKVIIEGASFATPKNMDFAISSPNDDILYIVDSLDRMAYFSSARESQYGKLFVYNVRVEKVPLEMMVLKGEFKNTINPGNRELTVEIKRFGSDETVGTFKSAAGNGSILLTVPKSGKYNFDLSVNGSNIIHRAEVTVPYLKEFRPLKLAITHQYDKAEQETMLVKTLFDERFEDPTAVMSEVYQALSKLNPNANQYDLDSLDKIRNSDKIFTDVGLDVYATPADVEDLINRSIADIEKENEQLIENSNVAHHLAAAKSEAAKEKLLAVKEMVEKALLIEDSALKNKKLTEAYKINKAATKLNQEAEVTINLGLEIEKQKKENDKSLVENKKTLTAVKSVSQDDRMAFTKFVEDNANAISQINERSSEDFFNEIVKEGNEKSKSLNEINASISELRLREEQLMKDAARLKETLANTKKKKEKAEIESQIQSVESEKDIIQSEIIKEEGKLDRFNEQDQMAIAMVNATNDIKSEDNRTAENLAQISSTQKLKIGLDLKNSSFLNDQEAVNDVFKENQINGEYADLNGLNESAIIASDYRSVQEVEIKIAALNEKLMQTDSETEKEKIVKDIEKLNAIALALEEQEATANNQTTDNDNQTADVDNQSALDNDVNSDSTVMDMNKITVSDIFPEYGDRKNSIAQIKEAKEKNKSEIALEEQLLSLIEKQIKEKEKAYAKDNTNLVLPEEISQLKELEVQTQENRIRIVNTAESVDPVNGEETIEFTYKDAIDKANPNYASRAEAIYNSSNSDEDKSNEIKSLNAATLANANEQLQEVEAQLNNAPNDANLLNEKTQLTRLVNELQSSNAIPIIEIEKPNTETVQVTKSEVTTSDFMPNYETDIAKIDRSNINQIDKEKAKLNLNQSLSNKITNEIDFITSDPIKSKDKIALKRIENLQMLNNIIEEEINISKDLIDKIVAENPKLKNSVESISPNYTSSSYEINNLNSDDEKIRAIQKLNEQAIQDLEDKIVKTKMQNTANPRPELNYEIEELVALKKEIQNNFDKDYYGVVILEGEEALTDIKGIQKLEDLVPEYEDEIQAIDDNAVSSKDLERKKAAYNEEVLADVKYEIRRLNNGLNSTPENKKQIQKRIASLEIIEADLAEKVNVSKAKVGDDLINYNILVDVEDVNPDYLLEIEKINALEDEVEQAEEVKKLNKESVKLIDEKIESIKKDIDENGEDKRKTLLIQKYEQLKAIIDANPDLPVKGKLSQFDEIAVNEAIDNDSTQNSTTGKTEDVAFPVIYGAVTIEDVSPNYSAEMDSIQNSEKPQLVIEQDKINLYEKTLNKIELEVKELETYLRIDSPNKEYATQKISNLNDLKSVIEQEKANSEAAIVDLETPSEVFVQIDDIMPDYDSRKEKIEYASNSTTEKLEKTVELNRVVIFEIEKEIAKQKQIIKDNPTAEYEANENIENLTVLQDAMGVEVENNLRMLNAISDAPEEDGQEQMGMFEPLNPDNFGEQLDPDQIVLIKKDVKLIEDFEKDISRLERKKLRASEGELGKIEKDILKAKTKQAILHNRLITDLEGVIDEKLWLTLEESKSNSIYTKGESIVNEEIRNAEEAIVIAKAKIEQAKALRKEANEIKNPILANDLFKKASKLEFEAQNMLNTASTTFKTAVVISELTTSDLVIVSVDKNIDNRASSKLYDLANDLDREAQLLETQSSYLTDSVQTVKKKYRAAILEQVERNEKKETELRVKADDLRYKAGEIEVKEQEVITKLPENINKNVSNTDQLAVLKTDVYATYFDKIDGGNKDLEKATEIEIQINELKEKASKIIRMAIVEGEDVSAENIRDEEEVSTIIEEIESLKKSQLQYKDAAITKFTSANVILDNANASANLKENMMVMASAGTSPETKIELTAEDITTDNLTLNTIGENGNNVDTDSTVLNEASSDYIPPSKLNGQIFRKTDRSVYSKDNPIPVNAKQPEGLVYKVQVGAFRNPLPPEYFNKFAPVSGQVIQTGVTRYMVGYFTNFVPANEAKTEIHGIGNYNDAFVVAYLNGERISIAKARSIEESGIIPGIDTPIIAIQDNGGNNDGNTTLTENDNINKEQNKVQNDNLKENISDQVTGKTDDILIRPKSAYEIEKASYYTSVKNAAPANQVEIIEGLFYTVQIGVYSQPVAAIELFNVSPLNSQLTKSGKIRYSTGIYTELNKATERKNQLVEIGIVDAFVTAYFKGDRIAIGDAKTLIAEKGEEILTKGASVSEVNAVQQTRYNKSNVYYRILIGKYINTVPSNVANYLFNDDNIYFDTEIDADNSVYLYTQKFFTISEVKKRLVEINELGFENMKIISFYNIQVIPFNEANKILNDEPIDELTEYDSFEGIDVNDIFYEADAIYYRVNVGTYNGVVPNDIQNKLNTLSKINIEQETLETGELLIHTENLNTFVEAKEQMEEIKAAGLNNLEIVAFHKYVQISVEKALEIKGK
ncbi:hypothetical protein DNU06_03815 [Putridiphycobacter roseus]|uniref:Uncharacterized protein n=1 Tax=Putridiphycobacter roseus TaxID=2219161 RepID=A0A2W1N1S7_9FLAO|nr:PD40 domain-containing protein [Putridiphycobacter roseus]PZE17754.1 hypothetical protein DNU06_03815 [Putridiphycobacter roseus]